MRREKILCKCGEPVARGSTGRPKAFCWECWGERDDERRNIRKRKEFTEVVTAQIDTRRPLHEKTCPDCKRKFEACYSAERCNVCAYMRRKELNRERIRAKRAANIPKIEEPG